jgi:cytochrome c553
MPRKLRIMAPSLARLDTRIAQPSAKTVDPWYHTAEHRAWSALIIRRARGRCQDPLCEKPDRPGRLFADHITELADSGSRLDAANGLARCGACHTRKTVSSRAARQRRDA